MKKVLFSSDCNGNFSHLFSKVAQLQAKNKFDLMLLTGNVCPLDSSQQFSKVLSGQIAVPLPVYFIDSSAMSKILHTLYPSGKLLAKNFYFLGQRGLTNIQGLNIAFISGKSAEQSTVETAYKGQFFWKSAVKALLEIVDNKQVDILLSNEWPSEVSSIEPEKDGKSKSAGISCLCYNLSPKYHLAASGGEFYRLEPFRNSKDQFTHFINVAEMKEGTKEKYLLAIQLTPFACNPPPEIVNNAIQTPFAQYAKESQAHQRQQSEKKPVIEGWGQTDFVSEAQVGFKETFKARQGSGESQKQSQMITEQTYVFFDKVPTQARNVDVQEFLERWGEVVKLEVFRKFKGNCKSGIAKFRLIEQTKDCLSASGKYSLYENRITFKPKSVEQKYHNEDCWFCLKNERFDRSLLVYEGKYNLVCLDKGPICDQHILIVPKNHVHCSESLEEVEKDELSFLQSELQMYFRQRGYETVTYERYMRLSDEISHCLIHLVALKEPRGLLHRFQQINTEQGLRFENTSKPGFQKKSEHYISADINGLTMFRHIFPKQKVDFDLMRRVICEMANLPQAANWRSCQKSEAHIQGAKSSLEAVLKECEIIRD